ncbi:hypothetical protein SLEP1_g37431 [Rubroshorea leprosula]|uniref:Guanylyl cyclase n=1 Tax=Rubroshorea leprosula TaxID=152421 RepID=A0AAV5KV54_9ROSI|nr:hypothetical protein SLEP1_g37431 [Rubroshorea leprosula]
MWPLYFLLNKIPKIEEEGREKFIESNGDQISVAECCPFQLSSNDGTGCNAVLPSHFVEVPHIKQLFSWDCGLACVLMVLTAIGINDYSIQDLAELCATTSIWTVDLAYLLQKFSVSFCYFTVTFGANPNYSIETFYKEQLPNDLGRIDMLFQKAVEAGISIKCRSIGRKEICQWMLSGKYIAIALVDQHKLSRFWLGDVTVLGFHDSHTEYTGHYILICGYDAGKDEFEIRDPASSGKRDRISSKCLEEARKSFGTDEDLLLISLEESTKQKSYPV